MIKHLIDANQAAADMPARRGFLARVGGMVALGLAGVSAARAQAPAGDGPNWPGDLKGRHRQVVDAYETNGGFPLAYAYTFLAPNASASAVVVLRHLATPMGLNDAMWSKYKIGATLKIDDPETKTPAVKNPFLRPKPGVLMTDDMAIDKLLAAGTMFGVCNVAIQVLSKNLAGNAGASAADAAKEWAAN